MSFDSKCKYCDNKPEFLVMVENDENPHKCDTEYVCAECLEKHKSAVIEAWSEAEVLNWE